MNSAGKKKVRKLVKQGLIVKTAILLVQLGKERDELLFNQKHYKEYVSTYKYDGIVY
jgi:hypothetical protein